jgi:hypothetical protein
MKNLIFPCCNCDLIFLVLSFLFLLHLLLFFFFFFWISDLQRFTSFLLIQTWLHILQVRREKPVAYIWYAINMNNNDCDIISTSFILKPETVRLSNYSSAGITGILELGNLKFLKYNLFWILKKSNSISVRSSFFFMGLHSSFYQILRNYGNSWNEVHELTGTFRYLAWIINGTQVIAVLGLILNILVKPFLLDLNKPEV